MNDLTAASLQGRVEQAIFRHERVEAFLRTFPPMTKESKDLLPSISWSQVERQLRNLAGPDFERVAWEVEILRASARLNPPEMFFLDLLRLAWSLIQEAEESGKPEPSDLRRAKPGRPGQEEAAME